MSCRPCVLKKLYNVGQSLTPITISMDKSKTNARTLMTIFVKLLCHVALCQHQDY